MLSFDETFTYKLCLMAEKNLDRQALYIDGKYYTYQQLFSYAQAIAGQLLQYDSSQVAILMDRSVAAYAGILACFFAGKVYVPLNTKELAWRLKNTYQLSGAKIIFTDAAHESLAKQLCHDDSQIIQVKDIKNNDHFVFPSQVTKQAYLMFTSGSTGIAKAVMIDHHQLIAFIENITARAMMQSKDHCAHITELSFDFSIYEIFSCWFVGACLYVFSGKNFFSLTTFIIAHQITCFACVPSTVLLLIKIKQLKHNVFPSVRYSAFCGEALSNNIAKCWHDAAPNSIIDNLYGPTEATVAICAYRWTPNCQHDVVPIGQLFQNQQYRLHNIDSRNVGELLLSGSQVIQSYWQTNEDKFFIDEKNKCWYKTGDLVLLGNREELLFVGRLDDQFKIRGYRVEKLEIELILKKVAKTESVAVVCIQENESSVLHAYVADCVFSEDALLQKYRKCVPDYMVPHKIWMLESLPYNKNGKVDYKKLVQYKKLSPGFIDLEIHHLKQDRVLHVALWYPSHSASESHLYRRHYNAKVAYQGKLASAPYPLLLFSHGHAGHRFNQHYLAEFMACHGYIVAAVEHDRDLAQDEYQGNVESILYDRVSDIQLCLRHLLQDPFWQDAIDVERIGILGHSFGGATALLLAGGMPQNNQFFQAENQIKEKISAMMLMAPAQANFFTKDSLESINLPALLLSSGKDELLPDDASIYLKYLNNPHFIEFTEAGHFIYLMECPQAVTNQCPEACIDIGLKRQVMHPLLQQHTLRFFNECFKFQHD